MRQEVCKLNKFGRKCQNVLPDGKICGSSNYYTLVDGTRVCRRCADRKKI